MKQLLVISILVFIFIGNSYAPDVRKFKVCVFVDADKEDRIEQEQMTIESHLKRELRALGNVVIVDKEDDWEFILMINVLGMEYKNGTKSPNVALAKSFQKRTAAGFGKKWPLMSVYVSNPYAAYWLKDDLPSYCIQIANNCDKTFKIWK